MLPLFFSSSSSSPGIEPIPVSPVKPIGLGLVLCVSCWHTSTLRYALTDWEIKSALQKNTAVWGEWVLSAGHSPHMAESLDSTVNEVRYYEKRKYRVVVKAAWMLPNRRDCFLCHRIPVQCWASQKQPCRVWPKIQPAQYPTSNSC